MILSDILNRWLRRAKLPRLMLLLALLPFAAPLPAAAHAPLATGQAAPAADPVAAPAPQAIAHPALWKVTRGGTTIWLFGTVHVLPKGIDWFEGPVKQAFDQSDTLVTEILEPAPADMQKIVAAHAVRDDGQTLRGSLDAGLAERYAGAMTAMGLPPELFDNLDTWYAALSLGVIPVVRAGYDTASGADAQVTRFAEARHMRHEALETADFQFSIFDSLPPDAQKTYLSEVIDQIPEVRQQFEDMVATWKTGDADALAAILNDDETMPLLREKLIDQRNANWAQWISQRLDKPGTVFIAVGAGHLAGEGSVQDKLAKLGIEAERVQ